MCTKIFKFESQESKIVKYENHMCAENKQPCICVCALVRVVIQKQQLPFVCVWCVCVWLAVASCNCNCVLVYTQKGEVVPQCHFLSFPYTYPHTYIFRNVCLVWEEVGRGQMTSHLTRIGRVSPFCSLCYLLCSLHTYICI